MSAFVPECKDLAAELDGSPSPGAVDDLPPALVGKTETEVGEVLQRSADAEAADDDLSRQLFRNWLNAEIPALGGKTPVEAAKDPALADAVLHRVKEQINVYDQRNLGIGHTGDVEDLLREHGLPDPGEPPPPKRPPRRPLTDPQPEAPPPAPPENAAESEFPPDGEEESDALDLVEFCEVMAESLTEFAEHAKSEDRNRIENLYASLPLASPPQRILNSDDLEEGPLKRLKETDDPGRILGQLAAGTGPDFLADLDAFIHELDLQKEERGAFCIALLQLWVCLVPPKHRKPPLSLDTLRHRYFEPSFPPLEDFDHVSDVLTYLCNESPQEDVCLHAMLQYLRLRHDSLDPNDPAEALDSSYPALLLLAILCDCWAGD